MLFIHNIYYKRKELEGGKQIKRKKEKEKNLLNKICSEELEEAVDRS